MPEIKVTPDQTSATGVVPFSELTARVAGEFAIEPAELWKTIKNEVFPGGAATDAQMFLVLQIMDRYKLNPFMREVFAAVSKKTGKLLVGIQYDGYNTIAHRHPRYRGFSFEHHRDAAGKTVAITCKVYRDDWEHPGEYYAAMSEWFIAGKDTWEARPIHQLQIKAFNNCVKLTLGLAGLYDSDDIDRIQASEEGEPPAKPRKAIETTARKVAPAAEKPQASEPQVSSPSEPQASEPQVVTDTAEISKKETSVGQADSSAVPVSTSVPEPAALTPQAAREKLSKLVDRVPPARLKLALAQQGVKAVADLNDEQVVIVCARLSKGLE